MKNKILGSPMSHKNQMNKLKTPSSRAVDEIWDYDINYKNKLNLTKPSNNKLES